ncbi:3'-5' exonuclease [Leptospira levettii]|uniref:3'-5' exonuclease n=1 Tax=Leptospira levettii TaxID=2023178 RepID=A0AAW5VED9_9LEPT|nr:3'-5' exonuclease [Leptospira levettii]MCW7512112.1 3'-5' exonuclease [Leptospira levettii]MCW7517149.1 3'-5' exonuclease [Leptospira levettii]
MNDQINKFTAIDFETAQGYRHTICQVGLVVVENGMITKEIDLLVKPPGNYYWNHFTDIHGIDASRTENSPTFDIVWDEIRPFIAEQIVVAHNGFSFDFDVLKRTLEHYEISVPGYQKYCTNQIYREKLNSLCEKFKIPLNHHDALSDAKACAELFLKYLGGKLK